MAGYIVRLSRECETRTTKRRIRLSAPRPQVPCGRRPREPQCAEICMNHERLLHRLLRYVRLDTTAGDGSKGYPSSAGQFELGRVLAAELRQIGLADAEQDRYGIVLATLPSTCRRQVPVIAFNAHLDTSPETTGKGVKPQVWRNYDGRDLTLPGDCSQVLRVAAYQ